MTQPPPGSADRGARLAAVGLIRKFPQGRVLMPAVNGLDLNVAPGELVALFGPSGSGKTTLIRLLGGVDRPDEGSIQVDGVAVERLSGRAAARFRSRIGFVTARATLLDYLSALDNVILPVSASRVEFSARMHARDLLERVGLGHRAGVLAGRLSSGERQRVAVARAMISRPRLVLADEPTGGLDSVSGEEILRLLSDFHRERGMTMVLATSDSAVGSIASRLIRMRDGVVLPARTAGPRRSGPDAGAADTDGSGEPGGHRAAARLTRLRALPGPES